MISLVDFGKLRLSQFRQDTEIAELKHWEFMDRVWLGEAVGFSEWLRLEDTPDTLRSLAIDFTEFPEQAAAEVLKAIDLPVRARIKAHELRELWGEPTKEHRFANDRVTYEFVFRGPPNYYLSCTVLNEGGLTYLVVIAPLPRRRG